MSAAVLALGVASAVFRLAKNDVLHLNGQSQGILFILALGAATDYSLLFVSRFREELRDDERRYVAMRHAYRASFEPILASGATVILALLCLLLSDLSSLRGPRPGRRDRDRRRDALLAHPAAVRTAPARPRGRTGRSARSSARSTRTRRGSGAGCPAGRPPGPQVWMLTFMVLAAFAAFVPTLNEDPVPQTDTFLPRSTRSGPDSSTRTSPLLTIYPVLV